MFAAFQGLSWSRSRGGPLDPRSEQARRRRFRARTRFRVEALEPRWLLSSDISEPVDSVGFVDLATFAPSQNQDEAPQWEQLAVPTATEPGSFAIHLKGIDDWSTALLLPNVETVHVNGDPVPGTLPDLLEIQVTAGTATLYFTFRSAWADHAIAETLQVFDANLNESISFTPDAQTNSFTFSLPVLPTTSSSWYVKISLPAGYGTEAGFGAWDDQGMGPAPDRTNSSGLGEFAYVLEVSRRPCTPGWDDSGEGGYFPYPGGGGDGYGGGDGDGNPEFPSPGNPTEVTIPPALPFPDTSTESQPVPSLPDPGQSTPPSKSGGGLTILVPVAVGPLPVRSAAPLGGVLASPDSFPSVDRHEGARADQAMFDPARELEDAELDLRQVVPATGTEPELEAARILALRGPGGLPMLATALIAGMTTRNTARAVAAETNPASPVSAETSAPAGSASAFASPTAHGSTTSAAQSEAEARAESRRTEEPRSSARRRRAAVLPGLTLAFALGLSLVLPDLIAAFQFMSPSRPALRLRWLRRAFRTQ